MRYLISDGNFHFVVKVDSKDLSKLVSIDQNIMWWEALMLQLMNSQHIPAPEFIFFLMILVKLFLFLIFV